MENQHRYHLAIKWTGNKGQGTKNYTDYERSHTIQAAGKPIIESSSDPEFRGDSKKYNPEELFIASLSSCHMLWYLHLCAEAGVIVVDYSDNALGTLQATVNGGHFTEVTLNPHVVVSSPSMIDKANELHYMANKLCFIANSCNFPIFHTPTCEVAKV